MPDYTDVAAQYACGGTGSLIDSIATPSALNFVEQNAVGLKTDGKFDVCRGAIGVTNHFRRNWINSHFDIRSGQNPSFTAIFWFRPQDLTDQWFLSIYDSSVANRQGYLVDAGPAANRKPTLFQYDGVTLNNSISVVASSSVLMVAGSWQFIGITHDNATKILGIFWGRDTDEYYYNTTAGFAAGFGLSSDVQQLQFGRFSGNYDLDHFSYWTRAFTEQDFLNHWRGGAGLAFDNFNTTTYNPEAVSALGYGYYYR